MLPGDGSPEEYELLTQAAKDTTVPGMVCEVGCRLGGGIQAILDGLDDRMRVIVSIDPYGDIAYQYSDHHGVRYHCGYDQKMMVQALATIGQACMDRGHIWLPFIMDDREFFKRFADGVPVYMGEKLLAQQYSLVHLDGPHDSASVCAETEFFVTRIPSGGAIVYDNHSYFSLPAVERILRGSGFVCQRIGQEKAVYRRMP
jgi:hypothetical protein